MHQPTNSRPERATQFRRAQQTTASAIHRNARLIIAVGATLAAALPATALDLTWDPDGALPLAGGTGLWNTTSPFWTADAGATFTNWTNTPPDNAIFNAPV